jgi:hypothetical protein
MPVFSQSSVIKVQPQEFFSVLSQKPSRVHLKEDRAYLCYWTDSANANTNTIITYSLNYGLKRIVWQARIINVSPDLSIEARGMNGPFERFKSVHTLESFRGRSLVRDEFEFSTQDLELSQLLRDACIVHAMEYRLAPSQVRATNQTQAMTAYGQQSA